MEDFKVGQKVCWNTSDIDSNKGQYYFFGIIKEVFPCDCVVQVLYADSKNTKLEKGFENFVPKIYLKDWEVGITAKKSIILSEIEDLQWELKELDLYKKELENA